MFCLSGCLLCVVGRELLVVGLLAVSCHVVVARLSRGGRAVAAWLLRGCCMVVAGVVAWLAHGCCVVVAWLLRGCCMVVVMVFVDVPTCGCVC